MGPSHNPKAAASTVPSRSTLVMVTGMSGAGKTTLARDLAARMRVPLVCRDEIKTALADALAPVPDAPTVGPWHVTVFWRVVRMVLDSAPTVIAESAADPTLVAGDLRELAAGTRIRVVHVDVPLEVAHRRYRQRATDGTRHPVHDDARRAAELTNNPTMFADYGTPPTLPESAADGSGVLRVSGERPIDLGAVIEFLDVDNHQRNQPE